MNQENKTPHSFCETPEEKCTMNYCDENGCQNRKRHLVEENQLPTASQSLYKWNFKLVHEDMVKCIDEHTRLHTASLREELEKLRAENERLKSTPSNTQVMLSEAYHRITAENQMLREALVKIANSDSSGPDTDGLIEIAKEALEGVNNE